MITVVTNTNFSRLELLERCKDSVKNALPKNAKHLIIPIYKNFQVERYNAYLQDEFVALVDDDDTIHPESISLCLDAILTTDSDLAFTDEIIVDTMGKKIGDGSGKTKNYRGIASNPRHCHHLALVRRSAISPLVLELGLKYNTGVEWFVKASAAFNRNKAVFVPIIGYNWTRSQISECKLAEIQNVFRFRCPEMIKDINTIWKVPNMIIPVYNIT